jgi:hypothetical protein
MLVGLCRLCATPHHMDERTPLRKKNSFQITPPVDRNGKKMLVLNEKNDKKEMEQRLSLLEKLQVPTKVSNLIESKLADSATPIVVVFWFEIVDGQCNKDSLPYDHTINTGTAKAITIDQLALDLRTQQTVYREIMSAIHYLQKVRNPPLYTIVNKQSVKRNLFSRMMSPSIQAYYYELIVDTLRVVPK